MATAVSRLDGGHSLRSVINGRLRRRDDRARKQAHHSPNLWQRLLTLARRLILENLGRDERVWIGEIARNVKTNDAFHRSRRRDHLAKRSHHLISFVRPTNHSES
jgi:hypothetical protein